jgi:hypothetical protein
MAAEAGRADEEASARLEEEKMRLEAELAAIQATHKVAMDDQDVAHAEAAAKVSAELDAALMSLRAELVAEQAVLITTEVAAAREELSVDQSLAMQAVKDEFEDYHDRHVLELMEDAETALQSLEGSTDSSNTKELLLLGQRLRAEFAIERVKLQSQHEESLRIAENTFRAEIENSLRRHEYQDAVRSPRLICHPAFTSCSIYSLSHVTCSLRW